MQNAAQFATYNHKSLEECSSYYFNRTETKFQKQQQSVAAIHLEKTEIELNQNYTELEQN